jgi:tRNA (cmo5U34)-methyltransferase
MRDELFADGQLAAHDFVFDEKVASVFDDMLERSVPLYAEVQRMVVELAVHFLCDGATVYDIGCSSGTTLAGIAEAVPLGRQIRLIGIEPSADMREQAAKKLAHAGLVNSVEFWPQPVEEYESLPDAQVIVMLYTLQFLRPVARPRVIRTLYRSLRPGGCLIFAEKILGSDPGLRRVFIDLYHDYKSRNGYSDTEIARKREALENVLIPFTDEENRAMLREAGFSQRERLFQWYNFAAYIAVKRDDT